MLAVKSVRQNYAASATVLELLENFRRITNEAVRIGLENNARSLKRLSKLAYHKLSKITPAYYRLTAISRAVGILSARDKSLKRGRVLRSPYCLKPMLVSCYGFRIVAGSLRFPVGNRRFEHVPLNPHTLSVLSEPALRVRSFTLTTGTLSICVSKEVAENECTGIAGVDRNLRELTYGNERRILRYSMTETVQIAERMRRIVGSFKRNDVRVRKAVSSKYGTRRANRVRHILHRATKRLVDEAFQSREGLVLEDIKGIRGLYRKGNGRGPDYRGMMNSWPFSEAQRQIEYKARWKGIPVIRLSRRDTRGTSLTCPGEGCGERLQPPPREDRFHRRLLYCPSCKLWRDRDATAVINLSQRGRLRFDRSLPIEAKGPPVEAMVQEPADYGNPESRWRQADKPGRLLPYVPTS